MKNRLLEIRSELNAKRYERAFRVCDRLRGKASGRQRIDILYYGACSLFGLGHIHQAEEWVMEHGRLSKFQPSNLYLQAYLKLHARRFQEALLLWTRILQADPSQTLADRLIERLKSGEESVFHEIRSPASFLRYIPSDPVENEEALAPPVVVETKAGKSFSRPLLFLSALLLTTALGVILGGAWYFSPSLRHLLTGDPYRQALRNLPVAPGDGTVIPPRQYRDQAPTIVYGNRKEALSDYRRARRMIGEGRVNQALLLLGRIELSNAGFEIKERALLLRDSIPDVRRVNFRDSVTPAELSAKPYLLRGARVLWTGFVASFEAGEGRTPFVLRLPEFSGLRIEVRTHSGTAGEGLAKFRQGEAIGVYGSFQEKKEDGRIIIRARELFRPE